MGELTRREALKRGALVGAGVLWATPVVQGVSVMRSAAAAVSPDGCAGPAEAAGARFRSFANTGGNEVYVGVPDLGQAGNRNEKGHTWVTGSTPVLFSYNAGTLLLTASAGGSSAFYTLPAPLQADSFKIIVADRDAGSQVNFLNVMLDGGSVGSFIGNDGFATYTFPSNALNDGFTFSGTVQLSGPFSNSQELSRVEIIVGCGLAGPA